MSDRTCALSIYACFRHRHLGRPLGRPPVAAAGLLHASQATPDCKLYEINGGMSAFGAVHRPCKVLDCVHDLEDLIRLEPVPARFIRASILFEQTLRSRAARALC